MKHTPKALRLLSLLLTLTMVLSMIPAAAAAEAGTILGDPVTVTLGSTESIIRENNFNKDWKFYLGNNSSASNQSFDDSSWDSVDLPHDFSIIQSYTTSGEAESGFLPGGTGWYRKNFTLGQDQAGKSFLLNFDGVYMHAYVYVNGTFVGEHHYGYTSFAFDITDYLICDGATENVIAVKAVNNLPSSRWYSGSGIYRDVTLISTDPVHVDLHGVAITTPSIASGNGTVNVNVELVNDSDASASVTVRNTVYAKGGSTALASAESTVTVAAGSTAEASSAPVVSSPKLWSVDAPNLYTVVTEVLVDGTVVDTVENTFGFRWFEFKSTGFYLNGVAVKLNGVCMHHDQGGLGSAAYYDAMYRQLSIMKEMGCNAIRTAHNPADEQYIEICNELGLLVIEETFDGLVDYKNENTNDFSTYFESSADDGLYGYASGMTCAEYAARAHVKRDRNAPSIIAWSFGNEIQEGTYWTNVSRYDDICANYISWVNDVDGTRPVTSGDNNRGGDSRLVAVINTITNAGGIAGFNYCNTASSLYSLAQSYGGQYGCIIASETASATNSRSRYQSQSSNSSIDGAYHLTSFDTSAVSWGITAHDSIYNTYQYDCVAGEFVWTGFDYLGEPTPWNGTTSGSVSGSGATPNSSYFGIVETTGFAKDTYWLYRSQWNKNATTVHLVTAWDSDNYMLSSNKVPVWLYSNAPKVELYLNGTLIGTATRSARTSSAGHTYYTYTSSSNNSSVCSVSSRSGADALYAVFNVAYTAGTLSAKAYDANGNEITLNDSMGQHTVTTPGTVTQLNATVNKTSIAADGSSLVYIEVDVLDANGNLDTTAANNIVFSLSGNGEILAVDNGDQATTRKYQQSTVLYSTTSANINAYAGKALVIVRSTEDAGSFTVNVTSSGLSGDSVTVTTTAVKDETAASGLVSYSMVRDYTVKAGTVPALETTATGTMADGSTVNGTITWNDVSADIYGTAGDYNLTGTLVFEGQEEIPVSARLHVIPNVIALRNISTATMSGEAPTLPDTVSGVLADGTLSGEFSVNWENVDAAEYDLVGEIVTVTGTAAIFGTETLEVTCAVRVAEAVNTESTNVAPMADSLTQDIASGYQSDVLESIRNETLKPGDNTSERWTNWNNRTRSADATLTFTWATAQMISSVNIYYYYDNCCAYPEALEFSYSLDGQTYNVIGHTAEQVETYSLGALYTYTFDQPINPVALKVKLTQQNGTSGSNCVGITELEVMTYAASLEYNTSADLATIAVDGTPISGFDADTLSYEAAGSAVTATSSVNAGITVLPVYEGVIRVLAISEDGSASKTYTVALTAACEHANTEVRNESAATCTDNGYTGDTYCVDCGVRISTGSATNALGHNWSEWDVTDATCTAAGSKTRTCSVCGETETETIAATGHSYGSWTVTTAATCTTNGVKTRTCSGCGNTETQTIAATGHSYGSWTVTTAATCTTDGVQTSTCSNCGHAQTQTIAATGHSWDDGVITQEPTESTPGVKTYTCGNCGETKTEEVAYEKELKAPTVSLEVTTNSSTGRLVITATVDDYENLEDYYEITSHGILYIRSSRIGSRTLTTNTSGRSRVNFTAYNADGSYVYNLRPTTKSTSYTIRAFLIYTDPETGKSVTVYSNTVKGSYNTLK